MLIPTCMLIPSKLREGLRLGSRIQSPTESFAGRRFLGRRFLGWSYYLHLSLQKRVVCDPWHNSEQTKPRDGSLIHPEMALPPSLLERLGVEASTSTPQALQTTRLRDRPISSKSPLPGKRKSQQLRQAQNVSKNAVAAPSTTALFKFQ